MLALGQSLAWAPPSLAWDLESKALGLVNRIESLSGKVAPTWYSGLTLVRIGQAGLPLLPYPQ